ncbi:MAG: S-methyl-5-thioribose-1-phosphate isomerase [Thermoanaerobaculia bacterium]|nr:S-methyl-5-thioribose-1-phosphate isomerase [Thermoanaerobaculia bacterium]
MSHTTPSDATSELDTFSPIAWRDGTLHLLDQTLLPEEERWIECRDVATVADAIRRLAVRGAPAIGVTAAYGLVVGLDGLGESADGLETRFDDVYRRLLETRPTAVNLRWALDQGREILERHRSDGIRAVRDALLERAQAIHQHDMVANRRMGDFGADLFTPGDRVLTHCNAGALATGGYGTAVGVITSAYRAGRVGQVWVDETRPLLQGARLTAWELSRQDIPHRLVTDSSVGALMSRRLVDRVVVGADRIAMNGDVANKIGTYTVAVLAARHGVPFYVAAPLSTIDPRTPTGDEIPIEERDSQEITSFAGSAVAPDSTLGQNFAFDVTPHELVSAIITEVGVLGPPFEVSIDQAMSNA